MNPSLAMLPCAFDAGKLYSVLPDTGVGDFTVSRNGSATYLGADGLLKTAQANEPRLEFNTDGSFRGVLVEPAATNLLLRSEEFENGYWTKFNTTILANNGIAPNGTVSADRFTMGTASTLSFCQRGVSLTAGQGIVKSVFFKLIDANFIPLIRFAGPAFVAAINVTFNLTTETGSIANSKVQNLGDGWYRCSAWVTAQFTQTADCQVGGSGAISQNLSCLIWGAQLEVGSVATSYIPTEATTITRPSDIITVQEPVGISEIKTTLNGTESTITPTGGTYQLPNGRVSRVLML
jgi:hypothetical protein